MDASFNRVERDYICWIRNSKLFISDGSFGSVFCGLGEMGPWFGILTFFHVLFGESLIVRLAGTEKGSCSPVFHAS